MASRCKTLNFFGLEKGAISGALKEFSKGEGHLDYEIVDGNIEYLIQVRITKPDDAEGMKAVEILENRIRQSLGQYLFSTNGRALEDVIGYMLTVRETTISVAESCTGGLISNMITNVPGSSRYFLGGIIAYSNQAKQALLNVSGKTLEDFGAVSDPTAREMAMGVRKLFESQIGLAITGIAGPDGGSKEKPVGTVHIGLSTANDVWCEKYRFDGKRQHVKRCSAMMALDWVRRCLNEDPFIPGF